MRLIIALVCLFGCYAELIEFHLPPSDTTTTTEGTTTTPPSFDGPTNDPFLEYRLRQEENERKQNEANQKIITAHPHCFNQNRLSPIDIDIANSEEVYTNDIVFFNYDKNDNVDELHERNLTDGKKGYSNWKNRPYIEGGPLKGRYFLEGILFSSEDLTNNYRVGRPQFSNTHLINGARYQSEIHLVHTKDGVPLDVAKTIPNGLVILNIFIIHVNQCTKTSFDPFVSPSLYFYNKDQTTWVPPRVFLPNELSSFFFYNGSFPDIPCNDPALWIIFPDPVGISHVTAITTFQHSDRKKPIRASSYPAKLGVYYRRTASPTYSRQAFHMTVIAAMFFVMAIMVVVICIQYRQIKSRNAFRFDDVNAN